MVGFRARLGLCAHCPFDEVLADEEYVFLHGSELAPFFEFFLWSYSLLSGLAVGILVWRKVAGSDARSQLAAVLVAALSGFLVSAFQFYALVFWALTVLVLGLSAGYQCVIDIVTSILRAPDNTPVPLVNPER